MKHLLTFTLPIVALSLYSLALLLLAATGWGTTNDVFIAPTSGWYTVSNGVVCAESNVTDVICDNRTFKTNTTDEVVRQLAADGRICEVFGHCWERLTPETQSRIALYQNGCEVVPCKCRICGKEETRTGDYK